MLITGICGALILLAVWRLGGRTRSPEGGDLERLRRLCEADRRESILPFE